MYSRHDDFMYYNRLLNAVINSERTMSSHYFFNLNHANTVWVQGFKQSLPLQFKAKAS